MKVRIGCCGHSEDNAISTIRIIFVNLASKIQVVNIHQVTPSSSFEPSMPSYSGGRGLLTAMQNFNSKSMSSSASMSSLSTSSSIESDVSCSEDLSSSTTKSTLTDESPVKMSDNSTTQPRKELTFIVECQIFSGMGIKRKDLHSHIKLVVDMNSYLTLQSIEDSVSEYSQVAVTEPITTSPMQSGQIFTPLDEKHFPQQMLPMIQHLNNMRLANSSGQPFFMHPFALTPNAPNGNGFNHFPIFPITLVQRTPTTLMPKVNLSINNRMDEKTNNISKKESELSQKIKNCGKKLDLSHISFANMQIEDGEELVLAVKNRAAKENIPAQEFVEEVDLSYGLFAYGPIFERILKILVRFKSIRKLSLAHGTLNSLSICPGLVNDIFEFLSQLKNLQDLDLSFNRLQEMYGSYPDPKKIVGKKHVLYEALHQLPIKRLNLGGITSTASSSSYSEMTVWSQFVETLLETHPTLESCDFSGSCFYVHKCTYTIFDPLLPIKPAVQIREINLSKSILLTSGQLTPVGRTIPHAYNLLKSLASIANKIIIDMDAFVKNFTIVLAKIDAMLITIDSHTPTTINYGDKDLVPIGNGEYYVIEHIAMKDAIKSYRLLCATMAFTLYKASLKFVELDAVIQQRVQTNLSKALNYFAIDQILEIVGSYFYYDPIFKVVNDKFKAGGNNFGFELFHHIYLHHRNEKKSAKYAFLQAYEYLLMDGIFRMNLETLDIDQLYLFDVFLLEANNISVRPGHLGLTSNQRLKYILQVTGNIRYQLFRPPQLLEGQRQEEQKLINQRRRENKDEGLDPSEQKQQDGLMFDRSVDDFALLTSISTVPQRKPAERSNDDIELPMLKVPSDAIRAPREVNASSPALLESRAETTAVVVYRR